MSEIVYENIVELPAESWPGVNVRVWFGRDVGGPVAWYHNDVLNKAVEGVRAQWVMNDPFECARLLLAELSGEQVNAIEVRIGTSGSIIYPEWP
jgi:hypothetical protein